jgi:hypothetical protein
MSTLTNLQLKNTKVYATPTNGKQPTAYDLVKSYQSNQKDDIPLQTGNANKVLVTSGTASSWAFPPVINTWNTAGRPAAPVAGQFGFNTQTNALDIYTGSAWRTVATV